VAGEIARLYNYGRGCACGCGDGMAPVALAGDKDIIQQVVDGNSNQALDTLQARYAGGFDKAVRASFGAGREYPDLERNLRINASRFGTYKAHDLTERLKGLSEEEAGKVLSMYNSWQKTEYDTLVARSRSAKQFERFREEADLYPNIEWLLTRSATPREDHLAYVGIILPIDDPFWRENQPGSEYRCKCDWRNTDKPSTAHPTQLVSPAQGLEGNPAETGELVTEEHPYFKRNPDAPRWLENKALLQVPDEVGFLNKETPHGTFREHLLCGKAQETTGNRVTAGLLLEKGYKDVKLMPQIYQSEQRLRERYFGEDYVKRFPKANPDFKIGNRLIESKSSSWRSLSVRIHEASRQADIILIRVNEPMTENYIKRFIKGQWEMADRANLREIILHINGDLLVFKRP